MIQIVLSKEAQKISIIKNAAIVAQALLNSNEFYMAIANKKTPFDKRFTSPQATPAFIANQFKNLNLEMNVNTYYKRSTKALAYTLTGVQGKLWINTAKLNRSLESIVATIIHEVCHLVDYSSPYDMHHGDNSPNGKSNTFPYWTDDLAQTMAAEYIKSGIVVLPKEDEINDRDDVQYPIYVPWYKRAWRAVKNIF